MHLSKKSFYPYTVIINATPRPTAFDYLEQYLLVNKGRNSNTKVKSILGRYIIPALGGPAPAGVRATPSEQQASFDFPKPNPRPFFFRASNCFWFVAMTRICREAIVRNSTNLSIGSNLKLKLEIMYHL